MRVMYCWRCKMDVPMLDESEYEKVHRLYGECMKSAKDYRRETGASLKMTPMQRIFLPVVEEYERLTGFKETEANAVMHHRILLYGPPCAACGKPLRTPKSRKCHECGTPRG